MASTLQTCFSNVADDIRAAAPADALLDAHEAHDELSARFQDLRAMKPATAALIFGSEANWKAALARVGVAAGRAASKAAVLEDQQPGAIRIDMEQIASSKGGVRWVGR